MLRVTGGVYTQAMTKAKRGAQSTVVKAAKKVAESGVLSLSNPFRTLQRKGQFH